MTICKDCIHARQVGDKSVQNIVGCVKLLNGDIQTVDVLPSDANIYEGYIYGGRKVGDVKESTLIGKGTLTFGLMTEATSTCKMATKI